MAGQLCKGAIALVSEADSLFPGQTVKVVEFFGDFGENGPEWSVEVSRGDAGIQRGVVHGKDMICFGVPNDLEYS